MDLSSAKIKVNRWLIVMFLGLTWGFSYEPPYIRYTYHEQLTSIVGYTDTQLGLMLSVYGTAALIFYVIGGVSADKFSCRSLIIVSLLGTALGCAIMATYPPFWVALAVEALWVVTTIALLWSPVAKVAALLGTQKEQGKILPMVSSFEGVGAFLATLSSTLVFSWVGAERNPDSLRAVWIVYTIWGLVLALTTYLFVPARTLNDNSLAGVPLEEKKEEPRKGVLLNVLKNPMTYIASFIVLGSYIVYSCLTYTQSYLVDIYAMDMTTASYFSIIRNQVMKIAAGPLSVVFMSTAILKSSPTRLCIVAGALSAVGLVTTLCMPANPVVLPFLMVLAVVLSFFALLGKAQNFACTGETGVDPKYFGTMTGVVFFFNDTATTEIYTVIGRWQETMEPVAAYHRIWYLAIFGCALMALSGVALLVRIKAQKKSAA